MQLHTQHPAQGYDALALQASDARWARSLLELLTEARADIRTGVNPELVERERTVQHKLDAAEKRRLEVSNADDTRRHKRSRKKSPHCSRSIANSRHTSARPVRAMLR